jgi:hypothetical protein
VAKLLFMNSPSSRIPGFVLAAAAAFAISFAPVASAQTAPEKKTTASKRNTAPAAATDPAPAPRMRETRYPYNVGVVLGPSFEGATAFKFRLEGAMSLQPLSRDVGLDLVLPLGFAFWGQSYTLPFVGGYDVSYFRFELVPSARFTFPVAREITLYGDAGLGFGYESVSISSTFAVPGAEASGAFGVFRLAGGGFYNLNEHWRLVLEPVGLNFYFGTGSGFAYSILLGANYRF